MSTKRAFTPRRKAGKGAGKKKDTELWRLESFEDRRLSAELMKMWKEGKLK